MLTGTVQKTQEYDFTEGKFQVALEFIRREDLMALPDGWVELGHGVRASIQRYSTMPAQELSFETHDLYLDLQYLGKGTEQIGVVSRCGLKQKTPYNAAEDVTFYEEPPLEGAVLLQPGDYVLLGPQDAHKPRCIAGQVNDVFKVVIKIPV